MGHDHDQTSGDRAGLEEVCDDKADDNCYQDIVRHGKKSEDLRIILQGSDYRRDQVEAVEDQAEIKYRLSIGSIRAANQAQHEPGDDDQRGKCSQLEGDQLRSQGCAHIGTDDEAQ